MSERFIGVDVGGTKVAVAVLDDGALVDTRTFAMDARDASELVERLVIAIQAAGEARAVGVAIPSVIEFATGRARSSVNVPLQDVPLRDILRERLRRPVYVDNDATCAALAEAYDDEGALVARHLVMFTIGTGVGGGIVVDGHIHRGATGAAGELGHTLIALPVDEEPFPRKDRFPQPGSLEALASGRALGALARERGFAGGEEAVAAARAGDERGRATVALIGRRLGVGIANAINTFDPDVVAIGGGVSAAGELLLGPARETASRYVLPGVGTATEIRLARHGPEAGVRGAALLAGLEVSTEWEATAS